jgi:hypothetical protein
MKPSDFFIGAMDFFSILMPGALLTFLLSPWQAQIFGTALPALDTEPKRWAAFAACAYFAGHLLHHMGSFLDRAYDRYYVPRKRQGEAEKLLRKTRAIMAMDLGDDADMTSAFSWAGSFVRARSTAAGLELERSGADSKFFRSLFLVAMIAALVFALNCQLWAVAAAGVLAVFSYVRFCKRRWDTSQRTYEYFLLLRLFPAKEQPRPGDKD